MPVSNRGNVVSLEEVRKSRDENRKQQELVAARDLFDLLLQSLRSIHQLDVDPVGMERVQERTYRLTYHLLEPTGKQLGTVIMKLTKDLSLDEFQPQGYDHGKR